MRLQLGPDPGLLPGPRPRPRAAAAAAAAGELRAAGRQGGLLRGVHPVLALHDDAGQPHQAAAQRRAEPSEPGLLLTSPVQAVPFIMQEVYLCGLDSEAVPRVCCPDQALSRSPPAAPPPPPPPATTAAPDTTTSSPPPPWYRQHPGFTHLANLDTCGRTFVNVTTCTLEP